VLAVDNVFVFVLVAFLIATGARDLLRQAADAGSGA
jgi:hypothetical protein